MLLRSLSSQSANSYPLLLFKIILQLQYFHSPERSFVNSCHPGDPCTTLSTALGYNTYCNPPSRKEIELDQTIPYLCGLVKSGSRSGDAVLSTTGGWYDGGTNPSRCRFGDDTSTTAKNCRQHLYDICDSFAVLKPV